MANIYILKSNNFTPQQRTPWGGKEILKLKKGLGIAHDDIVGESWEISDHPSFPNCPIELPFLAKLLNSEKNLSVQVHPPKGYKKDAPSKTEGWLILKAKKGAGIFLGFKNGVTKSQVESVLKNNENLTKLLNFVKVKSGDIFFIPSGMPHAIGAGLLLFEPQEKSETTYRFYDYGSERQLHIKDALAVTNWSGLQGEELVKSLRRKPKKIGNHEESLLDEDAIKLNRIVLKSGEKYENQTNDVVGLTVIEGKIKLEKNIIQAGQSAVVSKSHYAIESLDTISITLKTFV